MLFRSSDGAAAAYAESRSDEHSIGGAQMCIVFLVVSGTSRNNSRNSSKESAMITIKHLVVALAISVNLSGCASVQSAYNSTVDTVSGWFKSDDKKDQKK